MADGTDATPAQGADVATPTGSAPPVQGTDADAHGADAGNGEQTVEALSAKIAELERDNQAYRERERARERETRKATSETSTLADRIGELERELASERSARQEQSLRLASIASAQRLGFRNPDLAYRLLDLEAVDYGPDGTPRNVEKLLQDVAKSEPYLLVATDFGGGQRGASPAPGADMNAVIRAAAGRPPA